MKARRLIIMALSGGLLYLSIIPGSCMDCLSQMLGAY